MQAGMPSCLKLECTDGKPYSPKTIPCHLITILFAHFPWSIVIGQINIDICYLVLATSIEGLLYPILLTILFRWCTYAPLQMPDCHLNISLLNYSTHRSHLHSNYIPLWKESGSTLINSQHLSLTYCSVAHRSGISQHLCALSTQRQREGSSHAM